MSSPSTVSSRFVRGKSCECRNGPPLNRVKWHSGPDGTSRQVISLHVCLTYEAVFLQDYNVLLLSKALTCWNAIVLNATFEIGDFLYGGRAVVYALLAASDPVCLDLSGLTVDSFSFTLGSYPRNGGSHISRLYHPPKQCLREDR